MPRHCQPEQTIQRTIVQHLRCRGVTGLFWFAVPNGGVRSKVEAAIMKATGTRPGVPDLAFLHDGRAYFLEVKTEDGRPTEHQLKAITDINDAGGYAVVGCGLDQCLQILERWGLLMGRTQ